MHLWQNKKVVNDNWAIIGLDKHIVDFDIFYKQRQQVGATTPGNENIKIASDLFNRFSINQWGCKLCEQTNNLCL